MGYFAVLMPDADKQLTGQVTVDRLHINLWALRGLWFGRRLFYFDVGVELTFSGDPEVVDDAEVGSVEMLLPFRVDEGKWPGGSTTAQDLYDQVISEQSAPLIFGAPVIVSNAAEGRSTLSFEQETLEAVRISPGGTRAVDSYPKKSGSSLYTVALNRPLKKGDSAYIRMRWRVFGAVPLWRWVRPQSGAQVDFRVCDTRQGPVSQRDPAFLDRILPVKTANVFVMAPGHLSPTNVSPEAKHVRTLEPGAWSAYLAGAAKRQWVARNLLVYGWHWKATKPITEDDPFRIFLAIHRVGRSPGWVQVLYAAIGFVLGWGLLATSGQISNLSLKDLDLKTILGFLGITTVLGGWALLQRVRPFVADRAVGTRRKVRAAERALMSI